ncbi:hypothetical protein A5666_00080 [Mycolicibacterium fortuitum]|uniref:hypothetical protein n=1 Tax=Mycolicibacterium fortuitum TaxID=1766 RepID=UPI0007E9751D|nr:hypothetical protein [Mycolicibacterium fortuitum]OBA92975.1 hypothetical protein A5665_10720 [Mycolicibacterium fortuitum]OBI66924.1 hypothetical protein A5666_00080 [Mycolicibacterium fortuitum]
MAHPQNPATPPTTGTPYGLPGVVKILAREFAAAIDRGDFAHAETIRFSINALAESKPSTSARHLEVVR